MKKKTYINPEMEIVKIAANQQMLNGSPVGFGSGTKDGGQACGRDFDFDEEDEDDEEF